MAVSAIKLSPQLDEKNLARLESKTYPKAFTDIPNKALPATYKTGLSAIYKALTGEEMDEEATTFTVRADASGTFKKLYSPSVFSTEGGSLVVRWGNQDIPLVTSPGKIGTAVSTKGTKFSFKEEQIGKYKEPVLSVSATDNGTLYTFPIPIRSANYEEKISSDLLDMLLEDNPAAIAEKVQIASDMTKRGESTGERMFGPFVKVAHLPLGDYNVTTYRSKEGGQFGTKYYMQVQITEPFTAPIRTQVGSEWVNLEEGEVSDWAIVEPNAALKKILAAEPVIDRENPAILSVLEHGEYNNFPTAKCTLRCTSFVQSDDCLDIAF